MSNNLPHLFQNARPWQLALAALWLALFVGTHLPATTPILPGGGLDKWAHIAAYALLAATFAMAWQRTAGRLRARHLAMTWALIALYGAVDEWTQPLVGRVASVEDWLTDAAGAAIGVLLFALVRKWS